MENPEGMKLRHATPDDIEAIEAVIRESIESIASRTYGPDAMASALKFVARLDRELVDDGTYFVVEREGGIVACGGWSRRARLYAGSGSRGDDARFLDPEREPARIRAMFVTSRAERAGLGRRILEACEREARSAGFRRASLMAMLSGHAFYRASGYRDVEPVDARLEDGTPFPLIRMEKDLT